MTLSRLGDLLARIQQRHADIAQLQAEQAVDLATLTEVLAGSQEDTAPEELIAEKVAALRVACRDRSIAVTGDDHVCEADAAMLIGRSPLTMRNRRKADCPISWRRRGVRPEYSLEALARYLVERSEIGEDTDL